MKLNRSLMLSLTAALTLPASLSAQAESSTQAAPPIAMANAATHTSFGYLNALMGSSKTDLYMDGKAIFRNMKEGKAKKPKKMGSEGYSIQVNAAKIGLNYIDMTLNLIAGREYMLIPTGDVSAPQALLIDVPSLVVPKFASHIVFAVAAPDAAPVDVILDGQPFEVDVPAVAFSQPRATAAGKHILELQIDGVPIYGPKKVNLKKGQTTTLILTGTLSPDDNEPLRLESVASKGL